MPKYPNITVTMDLDGPDGNAFAIMAAVSKALRNAGATKEELTQYSMDSMSGDYDNLIAAQSLWVNFNE
jgi:ribosomal protein S9